jgi:hypothetical protein
MGVPFFIAPAKHFAGLMVVRLVVRMLSPERAKKQILRCAQDDNFKGYFE